MNKKENLAVTPKFRFPEFLSEPVWSKVNIGEFLEESRIKGSKGDTAKKLTVKLWGNGVFEKQETLKGSEILLVEDNEINQEIIIELLKDSGIKVDLAMNGFEAIKKAENRTRRSIH